ncbi:tape measure protein [Tenuifilum osseticum]|uniref:tape measure protein n=1 Tax=Tenuifilum osseticum TaxID=3374723 RepID=UPI0034E51731
MSDKLGPVDIEFVLKGVNISHETQRIKAEIKGIATQAQSSVDETNRALRSLAGAIGTYFSITALKSLTSDIVRVRGEFQQLGIALETMLGSKEKATKLQEQIIAVAARTPFSLQEVSQGVKQLLAYQESQDTVIDTMKRLGDVASGVGVPIGRLIMAYGQVKAKGRLMGDDLKQFTEAGIPLIAELAKQFGVAENRISEMVSSGKVGFNDVRQVIERLTNEGGMFYNLMEKQSKSLTGMVSNLGDAWDRMLNDIGQSNEGLLAGGISAITHLIENYQRVIDALKVLAISYGTYRAALAATAIAKNGLTIAESLHYTWLVTVEKAQRILNATILKNPYAWAAAGIAAIVSGLALMSTRANEAKIEQEALSRINDEVTKGIAEQRAKIEMLRSTAANEKLSIRDRTDAIKKLKEIMPGYNAELSREGKLINENTAAITSYIKQLEIKIKMQAAEKELTALYETERNQLRELAAAEQELNKRRKLYEGQNRALSEGLVTGGESGLAGRAAMYTDLEQLENRKKRAEESLSATRKAIDAINEEIVSSQVSLLKLTSSSAAEAEVAMRTIKNLEDEIAELERRYKEATDINDHKELNRLRQLILAKRKELEKYKIDQEKEQPDKRREYLDELLSETQSYQQKRMALEFQYQQKLAILKGDNRTTEDNLDELRRMHQQELEELDRHYGRYVERYRYLYDSITSMTIQMLRDRINRIRETIQDSNLSDQVQADALRALSDAEEALIARAPLIAINHLNQRIAQLKNRIKQAKDEAERVKLETEMRDAEYRRAQALENMFGNVAARLGEAREIAGYLSEELAVAVDLASNLASAFASLAAGNYVQGGIQLATSLLQLNKYIEDRRARKEQEAAQKRQEASNRMLREANDLLTKQLELLDKIRGVNIYAGLAQSEEQLKNTLTEYIKATEKLKLYDKNNSYYTWESSWFKNGHIYALERVKKYREYNFSSFYQLMGEALQAPDYGSIKKVYDEIARIRKLIGDGIIGGDTKALEEQLAQYEELLRQAEALAAKQAEILTGNTYEGVVDALAAAFDDGVYSAEEFAKTFEDIMKQAVINALKIQYLKGPLDAWYKEFAKLSEGGLTADEVARLREAYLTIAGSAAKAFEELKSITGINFGELADDANSLSGAIKGMSEETASILAGQFNALRINSAEHLSVARQALIHQAQTAQNTLNTVRMLTVMHNAIQQKFDEVSKKLDSDTRGKGL